MDKNKTGYKTNAKFYFGLVFIWSITFWSLSVFLGGINQAPGSILFYIGGAGPLISALIVTHLFEPKQSRGGFWSRTFDARRIPWRWLLPAFLVHPAIILAAGIVEILSGGELIINSASLLSPLSVLTLAFSVFILGPLPEEMGWRGAGYDRLEVKMTPLAASLTLGALWAVWHVPLFFIEDTFHYGLGFGSFRFWVFLLSNVPLTVMITWIYKKTDRSILAAAIIHFSGNMVGAVLPKSDRLALLELLGLILTAIIIIVATGTDLGSKKTSAELKQ